MPLALPAIAASMLIVFIKAVGDFGVPSILGGEFQVLPTLIYYQIHGFFNLNAAAAIAAVNVILDRCSRCCCSRGSTASARIATLGGTAAAARRMTSPGARIAGNAYCWLVIAIAVLPQLVIALASFADRWPGTMLPVSYTLEHYRRVGSQLVAPIVNSLILAGAATALCIVFGTVTAYASARGRLRARWALDATIMLPFVLPGLVIGVAYLTAFNSGPLVLTGTALILVLAYFTRRVAFVFRTVATAIGQIDPKLEDASKICGASWSATMRNVIVPLAAPAVLSGAILVFSTLIGEISATVLLYSARWKTIAISIYELVLGDQLAEASRDRHDHDGHDAPHGAGRESPRRQEHGRPVPLMAMRGHDLGQRREQRGRRGNGLVARGQRVAFEECIGASAGFLDEQQPRERVPREQVALGIAVDAAVGDPREPERGRTAIGQRHAAAQEIDRQRPKGVRAAFGSTSRFRSSRDRGRWSR